MIVRPWEPDDLKRLVIQPSQAYMRSFYDQLDLAPLAENGWAWTGETDEGVMAIAGLAPQWENRAIAWAMLSCSIGWDMVHVHRKVKEFLVKAPFRRIEATVDVGFKPGHRWMKMLGFEPEGVMRAYRPDGGDQVLYARVRR